MADSEVFKSYENIPDDLKKERRWCLYKIIERDGKKTKIPLQVNGKPAKSTDTSTWNTYDICLKALKINVGDGLGFMLGDGYLGIDIDKVTEDMAEYFKDNNADSMTADFLRNISTYAEFSPSGTGLHFIGKGKVPGDRKRYGNLEIYDKDRFFTVTGNTIKDKERNSIKDIESELKPLYDKYMPKPKAISKENRKSANLTFYVTNRDILEKLFDRGYFAYSGEDLRQIYNGNYGSYFSSQSEADFFMLQRLIYYTGNINEAVSFMERSGLSRDKWYKRRAGTNYLEYIAQKAFDGISTFYDWDRENRYRSSNEFRDKKNTTNLSKIDEEVKSDMKRYTPDELKYVLDHLKTEIKTDFKKYEDFLMVAGRNYKYPYTHQISICNVNKAATACAEYDYWKSIGRVVKRNEKGIPLLDEKTGKIKYIFDVSQTISRNHNISEVKLWEFDGKKHIEVLDKLINAFKQKDASLIFSLDEKIDFLAGLYSKQYLYKLTDGLSDDFLKEHSKLDILAFLKESVKVSMCARMGVEYIADEKNFKVLSNNLKMNDLNKLLVYTSGIGRQLLVNLGNEISAFERQEKIEKFSKKEQTKQGEERYNNTNSNTKENLISENVIGGKEDGRESNPIRQGIYSSRRNILSGNQGESPRRDGGRILDREDGGRRTGLNSSDKNAEDDRRESIENVWQSKTEIPKREQDRGLRTDATGRDIAGTFGQDRGSSDRIYNQRETKDDGALGIDKGTSKRGLPEIRRTDEESRYDIGQDGNGTNNLGIESSNENINKENTEKEVEQTSFSFTQNAGQIGFQIPLSQNQIDTVLINGGNEHNLRLDVIAEFSKGKTNEELADFLKNIFRGGNGFYLGEDRVCAWYSDDGIYLSNDISSRENYTQILSWEDAASRIGQLLDEGRYATNVELIEAMSNERAELAEKLWYLKGDLSEDVKANYLSILNEKQRLGYPEKTEYLAKMLQDKDFRGNLRNEYAKFLEEYKENTDILRFHYHNTNELLTRLDDLELSRKEFTTNLTDLSTIKAFITEDEIDANLMRGSNISNGKKRIYEYFIQNRTLQEQAEFLKNEYGTGGSSHALSGARGSDEWHDAKGIKLTKNDCKEVFFNWNQVAKRIEDLVKNDKYLTKEQQALLQAEKENIDTIQQEENTINTAISQNIENLEIDKEENNSENIHIAKEENKADILPNKEDTTPKFYSKDNPYDLVTDEMLERVPSLYEQEDISSADKEVHAAYIIPFKSNWTWYMTEYDKKTHEAFGLVLGYEPEWGYFNLDELKELNAQRLILEDFPTTFRELKDTELKKQMTEEELQSAFNGELTFDDKREEEILILQDQEDISYEEAERIYDSIQNNFNSDNSIYEGISIDTETMQTEETPTLDYPKVNSIKDISDTLFETLKSNEDLQKTVLKARQILGNNTLADFAGVFQREYARVMREVAEKQGNLPDDMKSIDDVKKLRIELEHRYNEYLSKLPKEKENVLETNDKADLDNKIAVKVGYYYAIVDKEKVADIALEKTGTKIYPSENNFEGKIYPLYRGTTFEESQKVDKLFDEIAVGMKEVNLTDLNDLFYLNNQGLYEISRDTVTEEKAGYDFDISSFGEQFPNYYEDIYVSNKNLRIDDAMQNIAHIGKDNELKLNVNLPDDEKYKVLEIRDKKEVLSSLIKKDVEKSGHYNFSPQSEEFILKTQDIEDERLKNIEHIKDSIDGKQGYEAELILDTKNMELKQNLKYNGFVVNTNKAIKYDSYNEMIRNLPYLLDDNHRDVLLTGYINAEIERQNEQDLPKEHIYKEGMTVKYKGKEYTVSSIGKLNENLNTIKLDDNESYMNGFITGSEILPFRDEKDLDLEIQNKRTREILGISGSAITSPITDGMFVQMQEYKEKLKEQERYSTNYEYMGGIPPVNYKITKDDETLPPSERLKNNIEAIKLLIEIEQRPSHATKEEQDILNKYIGWGGLSNVFDESKEGQWKDAREFLKDNLSPFEYEAAKESTLTAFYTPNTVINAIYDKLSAMGFETGNILEPSMGTGRFIGNLPDSMRKSKFYGVELDNISGRIAQKLYPNSNIQIKGFEETNFSNNLFDVAIGNVPFGEFKIADREYEKNNFLIHDYFFGATRS